MKKGVASSTALTVAQGVIYTSYNPSYKDLVGDDLLSCTRRILSASEEGKKRLKLVDSPLFRFFVPLAEKVLMPGVTIHYVLRKRGIEQYARQAIAQGATQIINLGAGLDILLYRLCKEYPEINFIEIDHPDTQVLKNHFFQLADEKLNNLHCLPIDFTHQTLEHELAQFAYYYPDKSTLFISEGVLMYLTETQVEHVFQVLKQLTRADLSFVFTALEPEDNTHASLLKRYLQKMGEPIHWYKSKTDLEAFVKRQGYRLHSIDTDQSLSQCFIQGTQPGNLTVNEYIAAVTSE